MKKYTVSIISIALILIFFTSNTANAVSSNLYGDYTGDGAVDSGDYLLLRRYLLDLISAPANTNWKVIGDLNSDGEIDSADYTILRKYLMGIIDKIPYNPDVSVTLSPTLSTSVTPTGVIKPLPDKETVLAKMVLANNYFLAKYPSPGAKADSTHAGSIWTKSTYMQGVMALYKTSNDEALYNYAVDWATFFDWNARSGNKTTNADDQCCMQTYIELYKTEPIEVRISNATTCADNMCLKASVSYWTWIDAIFMSMPVLVKLSEAKNNDMYSYAAYNYYNYTKKTLGLYNTSNHLWWRDSSFKGGNVYWSRGNGWVFAALARVLDVLPKNDVHYNEYKTTFIEMASTLKACQRTDGFWNPDLLNPENYGGKETSGTALFTYGMAWGINNGLLDSDTYLSCVQKGWNGIVNDSLHSNGFLGWVQGTGSKPSDGQPLSYDKEPNFEDYGLGAFLLAGSEVYKLAE